MFAASRHLRRSRCGLAVRHKSSLTLSDLLAKLLCNPELNVEDAKAELRWMKQSLRPGHDTDQLAALVARRAQGEPLQYILESTDFGPLMLKCRAPTLIPRPETADIFARLAHLISSCKASSNAARPLSIVDLCTGSAPIPSLLRHHLGQDARILGYDISTSAIELARENARETGLNVELHVADVLAEDFPTSMLAHTGGRIDILVSNPPYITQDEYRSLPTSVRNWEDPAALIGDLGSGRKGLQFYERIAALLPEISRDHAELDSVGWKAIPRVAVEIGAGQGSDVRDIIVGAGMARAEVWQDQYSRDRMIVGWDM